MNGQSYNNTGFILLPNQIPFIGLAKFLATSQAMPIKQLVTTTLGFEKQL